MEKRSSQAHLAIRVLRVDDWPIFRQLRLEALREAPYAFCSTLERWQGTGDTEVRWRGRLTDVPFNVVAYLDGTAAGMASGTNPDADGQSELISMWVAPFGRGHGVADVLINAVISWAQDTGATSMSLDVMHDNARAIQFYRRHGFGDAGLARQSGSGRRRMSRLVSHGGGIVRALRPSDIECVKNIDIVAFPANEQYGDATYDSMLESGRSIVVQDHGTVVGYAFVEMDRYVKIRSIAVHPSYRRRGYGRALMRAVIEAADHPVELLVSEDNEAALRLYRNLGFEPAEMCQIVPPKRQMVLDLSQTAT